MTDPHAPTMQETLPSIAPEDQARAIFNILEDFAEEKDRLEETQKAIFNILDDFAGEKDRLEEIQKAVLNILEDSAEEKERLEQTQRAMLNLLDDFDVERAKTEAANRELSANEERLQVTLGEKENLLKEIHHRVKNNLQIIHSMLNLQMSYVKDQQAIELFKESKNRVYSMALIHERLYQSESLATINLPEYIRSLTTNLFLSYGVSERVIKPMIRIENAPLDIDRLIPLALVVTELISNSLKHAFPDLPGSADVEREIRVELRRGLGNQLLLTVGDNGVGMPDGAGALHSNSLGLKLVKVLVRQLRGTIQMGSGPGTEFQIAFEGLREGQ